MWALKFQSRSTVEVNLNLQRTSLEELTNTSTNGNEGGSVARMLCRGWIFWSRFTLEICFSRASLNSPRNLKCCKTILEQYWDQRSVVHSNTKRAWYNAGTEVYRGWSFGRALLLESKVCFFLSTRVCMLPSCQHCTPSFYNYLKLIIYYLHQPLVLLLHPQAH